MSHSDHIIALRVYTNCADRKHYKAIFDIVQTTVERLMGKLLRFKGLSSGSNLMSINVDLEASLRQTSRHTVLVAFMPQILRSLGSTSCAVAMATPCGEY